MLKLLGAATLSAALLSATPDIGIYQDFTEWQNAALGVAGSSYSLTIDNFAGNQWNVGSVGNCSGPGCAYAGINQMAHDIYSYANGVNAMRPDGTGYAWNARTEITAPANMIGWGMYTTILDLPDTDPLYMSIDTSDGRFWYTLPNGCDQCFIGGVSLDNTDITNVTMWGGIGADYENFWADPAPAPEPASLGMAAMGFGLAAVGVWRKKKGRR